MEIPRTEYMKIFHLLKDEEEVKIITGVRRSGKTFFLKMIIKELEKMGIPKENILYINFESSIYDNIKTYEDLNKYVFEKIQNISGKKYLLFDEIQNIKGWEKSINAYRIDIDSDIYITCSNSNLLADEFATLLSGRYRQIKMFPLSFNEILNYKLTEENEIFKDYINFGGLPRVIKQETDEKLTYINDIYYSIFVKDILIKNKIKDTDSFERLIKFIISHIGKTFSSRSISKYLKSEKVNISPYTLSKYLNYAIIANLLIKIPREDIKEKRILTIAEKYYVIDPGFYQIQTGINKNYGQILENIVLLELLRKEYEVTVGKIKNYEINFIARKINETIYIQVSQTVADENTFERELRPLKLIKDNYKKYIITMDQLDYSNEGIIHLNIIDFLKDF